MDSNIDYHQVIEESRMLKVANESKKNDEILISETSLLAIMKKIKMKGNKK